MTTSDRVAQAGRIGPSRAKRAAALVPLAMLSAAWTVSVVTSGGSTAAADDEPTLPDGSVVPAQALRVPASVTESTSGGLSGATGETARQILASSSASAIPAAALAAYQRAETVINRADPTCRVPWQLIAAIGRVESDHGRAQGNQVSDTGLATPGIFGPALDGTGGTSRVTDTDGGVYDADDVLDRAVGPMQFIPSTWATVGVDADGDGKRDPQNVNDAALGAAVYLCAGTEDLSAKPGQRNALLRYNHSSTYVDTVLAVYRDYLAGDYSTSPDYVIAAPYQEPVASVRVPKEPTKKSRSKALSPATTPSAMAKTPPSAAGSGSKPDADTGAKPSTKPSATPTADPTSPSTPKPVIELPKPPAVVVPTTGVEPIDKVLTKAEATAQCLSDWGYDSVSDLLAALTDPANLGKRLPSLSDLTACVNKLLS